jgi:GTP cyclohydrolase I
VVGLSKLARLVDCFARRLQIQERMTREISQAMMSHLQPLGCAVVLEATHGCMVCRGVKKEGATMVTSSMEGDFRNPATRSEFLSLIRH